MCTVTQYALVLFYVVVLFYVGVLFHVGVTGVANVLLMCSVCVANVLLMCVLCVGVLLHVAVTGSAVVCGSHCENQCPAKYDT
jgi:hypothetical protein